MTPTAAQKAKSAAAQAEERQDTASEQLEGQVDVLEEIGEHHEGGLTLTDAKPEPAVDEFAGLDEKTKRSRLYSRAQSVVLANHKDEFNQVAEELFSQHNLVFARKKTAKEKAADQIAELLGQFPDLKPQFPGLAMEAKAEGTPPGATIA